MQQRQNFTAKSSRSFLVLLPGNLHIALASHCRSARRSLPVTLPVIAGHFAGHCWSLCRSLPVTLPVIAGHFAGHCRSPRRSLPVTLPVIAGPISLPMPPPRFVTNMVYLQVIIVPHSSILVLHLQPSRIRSFCMRLFCHTK